MKQGFLLIQSFIVLSFVMLIQRPLTSSLSMLSLVLTSHCLCVSLIHLLTNFYQRRQILFFRKNRFGTFCNMAAELSIRKYKINFFRI